MARKAKAADPVREAAADYFAGRSHDAWRREFQKNNPKEKAKPRMRMRGGVMVDVNQPWSKLHAKAKADNKVAAYDAYDAVMKFPNDLEAASDYVHVRWMVRNKADPSQPKALFKPYSRLPEIQKDKDRAHVDNMKKALAAVRRKKSPKKAKRAPASRTVEIDAKTWARLESAAKKLSAQVRREVTAEALAAAGIEAMLAVVAKARPKKG